MTDGEPSTPSVRCECTPVYDTRYGGERGRPPSVAVVEAIAAVEGVAPTELDPLADAIDPAGLDGLFEDGAGAPPTKILHFTVRGWNVFVRDDGTIRVCDPDRPTDPTPAFEKTHCD
ncbi:MAG: HalOD1 output domain-containing protein [Haloferacaceae archaeon]